MQHIKNFIAPSGTLRVALNFGNPVLAKRRPDSGEPYGVSVELAQELARRIGVACSFVAYDAAGHVFSDVDNDVWDLAFMAIDPVRAERVTFTPPYVIIEGTYMVRDDSPLQDVHQVDQPGVRVAVGKGAAYDLFLSRHLANAELVRASTSATAIDAFIKQGLDAVAGVRQPLLSYAAEHPGFRVMPGHFTAINQAMAVPHDRDVQVSTALESYIRDMKDSGFVADALIRSGETAATVAS